MAKVKAIEKKPKTKSGTEVDPQVADALASEAERGYDLSNAARARLPRMVGTWQRANQAIVRAEAISLR